MKNCTAVILAGCLGTRLNPVLPDLPKALAQINGRPFLSYLLDQLIDAGCQKVVLCTGHLGQTIQNSFGACYQNIEIAYSRESSPLGTGGALRLALPFVRTEDALVMNGDSFCRTSLEAFYRQARQKSAGAAMLLTQVPDTRRFGRVIVDDEGKVSGYLEKDPQEGSGWINVGIYVVKREWIASIAAGRPISLEKELIPDWIQRGLYGHRVKACFLDIGTVESYNEAGRFFAEKNGESY